MQFLKVARNIFFRKNPDHDFDVICVVKSDKNVVKYNTHKYKMKYN